MRCNPWRWIWGLIPIVGLAWVAVQVEHARIERDLATRGKQELARLGLGWADLSFAGRDGTLSGQAADEGEAGKAAAAALETWGVRGVVDHSGLIDKVDRYEWTAMRRDNRIRLNGLVPTEKTRRDVIGIVKASFPNLEIEDRLRLARGAPPTDTWLGGVGFGIKQLAHLKSGQVDLEATSLSVAGEAVDAQGYRAVKSALARGLPPGIRLKHDRVTAPVVKPYVWSARLARDRLVLSGYVVSEKAREDILAAVRGGGPKIRIDDEMHAAEGAPDGWAEAAIAAVRGLLALEEGSAEMRDASLGLAGLAESTEKAEVARGMLRQLPASFKISDQVRAREPVIPAVSPYTTRAVLEGGVLTLTGHIPAEEARQSILKLAQEQLRGIQVRDDLQLSTGHPTGWRTCVETALVGLARAGNGTANLVDGRLEVLVSTAAGDIARSLPGEIRSSVGNACEADVRVTVLAPPEPTLRWAATHDGRELILTGQVAGEEAHGQLVRAAGRLFPAAQLSDRTEIAQGKSERWVRAAYEGLSLLSRLRRGEVLLVDSEVTLTGETPDAAVQSAAREALARTLPEGYRGRETIAIRPDSSPAAMHAQEPTAAILPRISPADTERQAEADTCQALLRTVMRTGTIHFDRDSARLNAASLPTLRRLASVANSCPGVRLEVGGHTDADGRTEHNQMLSERRAHSIAEFLARAGVNPDRMRAVGYGETRPLAPNDTAGHKARNRRIEFTVKTD